MSTAPEHSTATRSTPPRTKWALTPVIGIAGALLVALVVLAFVWPAATAKVHDLPVGISGPSAQVTALKKVLAKQDPSPFALHTVSSRADAVAKVKNRTLYGAILLGSAPEVLTSSAASSAANSALRGVATALQTEISTATETALISALQSKAAAASSGGASGTASGAAPAAAPAAITIPKVTITDVVPLSKSDPLGAGLNAASFPLVLGGMMGGVLVSFLVVGVMRRLLALLVYGAAAGVTVTLVLQTWLHVLHHSWLLNAGGFGLSIMATASLVVGCNALFGTAGIGIGSLISLLIGNPISGAAIPSQFIFGPWGAVGQYFVPGAASTLVRDLSYFPDADTSKQWLVVGAWAVGGIVLALVGHFRAQSPIPLPEAELEHPHEAAHLAV